MTSFPTGENRLGFANPNSTSAYASLITGSVLCLAAVSRLIVASVYQVQMIEWLFIAAILTFAASRIYIGMRLLADIFVDVRGPAPLRNETESIDELVRHRRIATYQRPKGLVASLLLRIFPERAFLTPPYKYLRDDAWKGLAFLVAGLALATVTDGILQFASIAVVVLSGVAVGCRAIAIQSAAANIRDYQPEIQIVEHRDRLQDAGNPIDLFVTLKEILTNFRERSFQNRLITENCSNVGHNAKSNSCKFTLCAETQPLPLDGHSSPSRTVFILELGGAVIFCLACIISVPGAIAAGSFLQMLSLLLATTVGIDLATDLSDAARSLACTFRFKSNLFLVHCEGSYVTQDISLGATAKDFASAKGQTFKSDLVLEIFSSRIISESGFALERTIRSKVLGAICLPELVLEHSPRHILSAVDSPEFMACVNKLTHASSTFRDSASQLRTPEINQDDHARMMAQNLAIASAMASATRNFDTQQSTGKPGRITQDGEPDEVKSHVKWRCPRCSAVLSSAQASLGKNCECKKCGFVHNVPKN